MFRRDVKVRFNETKYNFVTQKGVYGQTSHLPRISFHKHLIGATLLTLWGFSVTKRYMNHHVSHPSLTNAAP